MSEVKHTTTQFKTALLKAGWANAITLLSCLERHEPQKLKEWMRSGGTSFLMAACERFRSWSIYSHRKDPMPFDNDVLALDAVFLHIKTKAKGAA